MSTGESDGSVRRTYFRQRPPRRALIRRRERYEVWQPDAEPTEVWGWELDTLLDGRHYPADFWAAVHEAGRAFREGDDSWVGFPDGQRCADPPSG